MTDNAAGDLARTGATQQVEGVTDVIAQGRETLRLYAASGERVTIGWTLSDGSAHKQDHVYPAAQAQVVLDVLEGACITKGVTLRSLTVFRIEGGLFLDDEPENDRATTAESLFDLLPSPVPIGYVVDLRSVVERERGDLENRWGYTGDGWWQNALDGRCTHAALLRRWTDAPEHLTHAMQGATDAPSEEA